MSIPGEAGRSDEATEIFGGALRIGVALLCVLGALAVSLYALSVVLW